jgi:hypothetical protein
MAQGDITCTTPGLLLPALQPLVVCRLGKPGDPITATGIPPHTLQRVDQLALVTALRNIVPAIEASRDQTVQRIMDGLEERAVGAGTVTHHGVQRLLDAQLAPLMAAMDRLERGGGVIQQQEAVVAGNAPPDAAVNAPAEARQLYVWGGRFNLVPEDFQFPNTSTKIAWQLWCCGDAEKGYPPLRQLTPQDMSSKNLKKRLSDFRTLMRELEVRAKDTGVWRDSATVQEANEMFAAIKDDVLITRTVSESGRVCRPDEIKWSSMVTMLHRRKKQQRQQQG